MVELLPFTPLAAWLLPPPLNALMAVGVLLGILHVGKWAARRVAPQSGALVEAAIIHLTFGVLCAVLHAVAWLGIGLVPIARVVGGALFLTGVLGLRHFKRPAVPSGPLTMIALLCGASLVVGALGPATDADSLDYHLGVPLDWLNQGHARPRLDWLHARLAGLGEMIPLLGIAVGTDCLSALTQAAVLFLLLRAMLEEARDDENRTLARLFTFTTPAVLFLVLSQKPQLLPAVGTTLAFMLVTTEKRTPRTIFIAMLCATFSASCKYSMYVTAGLVFLFALVDSRSRRSAITGFVVGSAFFLVPLQLRTFVFYGDPVSPLLERHLPNMDIAVERFCGFLQTVMGVRSPRRILEFLVECVVPTTAGGLTLTLGVGALAWVTLVGRRVPRAAWMLPLSAFILTLAVGQLAARFALEPYWWAAVLVVRHAEGRARRVLTMVLGAQSLVVTAAAAFGALTVGTGMLTPSLRESTLRRHADSHAIARFVDEKLPADAIILPAQRPMAIWPRPALCTLTYGLPHEGSVWKAVRSTLAATHGPVFAVTSPGPQSGVIELLSPCFGDPVATETLPGATRNPFNRADQQAVTLIPLRLSDPACQAVLAR